MVEKEISSDNNWREAYWEIAFCCVTSSHRVPPFPSWKSLLTLFSCVLQRDIWELIGGYGEKGNNLRSELERGLLRNCISMCECNSQSYTFLFSVQFANTVFWKSALGYLWTKWSLQWQRKYPQIKTRRKLSWKLLGDGWIHLTELHLCFMQQSIITVFEETERTYLDRILSYADNGNIISSKRERSFLRNFFVICEFLSQSNSRLLRMQIANTLFVESAKWDLGAHRGPCWNRKYPQIITGEKLSERLLSDMWLYQTEFHPSLLGTVC